MKSGFVSLIGRPNAGKSTLINTLIGSKIAIVSSKPQTTRNIIQGVYNDADTQIIFVDTPGIHKPINKLGKILNKQSLSLIDEVDVVLLLIDGSEFFGNQEKYILEVLKSTKVPVILVINKVDLISKEELIKKINERVGFVYLIGETGTILAEEMNKVGYKKYKNLGTLEKVLLDIKQNIDFEDSQTILFSPATASFDQFKNFEERGRIFK